ncbi:MAG: hypothetical protein ACOY71_05555 [Gemmatimonadota bacterium]
MRLLVVLAGLALVPPAVVPARSAQGGSPSITGTWRVDPKKLQKEGPREVIIRPDSSASWGKETVRWRLKAAGDSIAIAIGGEWETYRIKVKAKSIVLSGGDLTGPITLQRVGPATPRPEGVPVPPAPDGR